MAFTGSVQNYLEEMLSDSVIDRASINALADMNRQWGTKRGNERADTVVQWLAMDMPMRAQNFGLIRSCWTNGSGAALTTSKNYTPTDPAYAEIALALYQWTESIGGQIQLAKYADRLAPALLAGKAFALKYQECKQARGLVDFDDMIGKTAALLSQGGMADWVRYKLDRQYDHILIDEAQDTNEAQWDIARALSDDFLAVLAARVAKAAPFLRWATISRRFSAFRARIPKITVRQERILPRRLPKPVRS
ncbi:MAG: UvrD-helicase domain-containing protein [Sphingomonadales bacterium]|nr:UvrD-helicase domain-containing protein [Sphingomonadales bacterium]